MCISVTKTRPYRIALQEYCAQLSVKIYKLVTRYIYNAYIYRSLTALINTIMVMWYTTDRHYVVIYGTHVTIYIGMARYNTLLNKIYIIYICLYAMYQCVEC